MGATAAPRVAIVGSRDYPERARVTEFVAKLARKYPSAIVISGGARGVDTWAESAASRCGLHVVSYRPFGGDGAYGVRVLGAANAVYTTEDEPSGTYATYGDAAFARNTWIVREAERVVAFWDRRSHGTRNTISEARRLGRSLYIIDAAEVPA